MVQEKIKYSDIMGLEFTEQIEDDPVYEKEFGFPYTIIEKNLTKKISLDWSKETQLCELIRVNKKGFIVKRRPVKNLAELIEIIDFFENDEDYTKFYAEEMLSCAAQ